jgi:hypothetical protein
MPQKSDTVTITISLDQDIKELIERYANELDLNLSRLTKNLMYEAFRHFQIFDKIKLGNQMLAIRADNFRSSMILYSNQIQKVKVTDAPVNNKVQISIIIESEVKDLMSEYSKALDIPLKLFAANMVYIGLNDLKLLHNIGIVRIASAFEKFIQAFEKFKPNNHNNK